MEGPTFTPIIFFALACLAVLIFNLCARRPQAGISGIPWLMDRADAHPMRDVGSGLPAWTAAFTSNLTHNCLQGQCPPWAQRSYTSHNMEDSARPPLRRGDLRLLAGSALRFTVGPLTILDGGPLVSLAAGPGDAWVWRLKRSGTPTAWSTRRPTAVAERSASVLIAPSLRQSVWATSLL